MIRRLVLLRHAKSDWPSGVPDHDRPLAGKGRRNAQAAGQWLRREGPTIDLVLCSDAVRARHTWEIAAEALRKAPKVKMLPELYGAEPREVLKLVAEYAGRARTVLVVGHEPTMSGTTLLLAGRTTDRAGWQRLREKFPTSGISVLRTDRRWTELGKGQAVLETFTVPRA